MVLEECHRKTIFGLEWACSSSGAKDMVENLPDEKMTWWNQSFGESSSAFLTFGETFCLTTSIGGAVSTRFLDKY